ncbi:uncharacterized protein LOC120457359 [Drosophila santomea]|uniref:uncharacterized protein LOC120457359 n=1 Tax=Drosophila santomea TaxID=129105 RepID=UPI0019546005|nr:uncharacterized protein LOC120457359 [Drosophila santomea]
MADFRVADGELDRQRIGVAIAFCGFFARRNAVILFGIFCSARRIRTGNQSIEIFAGFGNAECVKMRVRGLFLPIAKSVVPKGLSTTTRTSIVCQECSLCHKLKAAPRQRLLHTSFDLTFDLMASVADNNQQQQKPVCRWSTIVVIIIVVIISNAITITTISININIFSSDTHLNGRVGVYAISPLRIE